MQCRDQRLREGWVWEYTGRLAYRIVFDLEGIPFDVFLPKFLGERGGHLRFITVETGVHLSPEHHHRDGRMEIVFNAADEGSMELAVEWCEDLIDTTFEELEGWSAQEHGEGGDRARPVSRASLAHQRAA